MHSKIFVLFIILSCFYTKSICKNYRNYTLYRGMPVNEEHLSFLFNLEKYNINYWRSPSTVFRPVEFIVPPEIKNTFLRDAEEREIYLTTLIPDLQSAFDKQTVKSYIRRNMESFDWQSYFRLKDINRWLKDLSAMFPEEMKMFSIGRTEENRHIYAVRILLKGSKKRSRVVVEGGIHAREWISTAFVTYMISDIIFSRVRNDTELLNIAMTYEWYFVPVLNPDGYEYSHIEDRLWRKNRSPPHGVDLNRNFGYGFGSVGVSTDKYSEIYCGSQPFSEKESRAMRNFVKSVSENLEYYIGFHSYGQYMIIPYAHSTSHTENYDEVAQMGLRAAYVVSRRYGIQYTVGTAYDTVGYRTSGVSGCWVKKAFRVPYVMTIELRDNGQHGFALPTKLIIPTCRETMDGMVAFLKPQTARFEKLRNYQPQKTEYNEKNEQKNIILDVFVFASNVLLFIIVRFDCVCV